MAAHLVKVAGGTLRDAIRELFDEQKFVPRGKVFIKPNLCAREPGLLSENSDIRFMKALAEFLVDKGCRVIIGHGANQPTKDLKFPFKKVIEIAKLDSLKGLRNVKIVDLDKERTKAVTYKGFSFHVPKIVFDADLYINLAKMKTHMQTYVSLSLKNQLGLITVEERKKVHRTDLDKLIAFLGKAVKPDLSIIEGLVAMEGNGPHHGKNKRMDVVMAGDDMVELDSLACHIMGLDRRRAEHIVSAQKIGAGGVADRSMIRRYERYAKRFKPAQPYIRKGLALYTWPTSGCPGCLKALEEAAGRLKRGPGTALRFFIRTSIPTHIVLGTCEGLDRKKLKGKLMGFGNCSKGFCKKHGIKHYPGCPMSSREIEKILAKEF